MFFMVIGDVKNSPLSTKKVATFALLIFYKQNGKCRNLYGMSLNVRLFLKSSDDVVNGV